MLKATRGGERACCVKRWEKINYANKSKKAILTNRISQQKILPGINKVIS